MKQELYHPLSWNNLFKPSSKYLDLGDRLTDERVQCAQAAMSNAETPKQRLEGFISKTEDFHRLMNFLEVSFQISSSEFFWLPVFSCLYVNVSSCSQEPLGHFQKILRQRIFGYMWFKSVQLQSHWILQKKIMIFFSLTNFMVYS